MKHYSLTEDQYKLSLETVTNQCLYPELFSYINRKKQEIDQVRREWDSAKKVSNAYEYIYTSSNMRKNVSSFIPVSRSFFKLREIIYDFQLDLRGTHACIAEAPGGFIQSIIRHSDERRYPVNPIYGITLLSADKEIPYWNPLITNHPRVIVSKGKDGTGDLYQLTNVLEFVKTTGKQTCQLVTADGGFDYTRDFEQELSSYRLLYSEIMIALQIQITGGTFVCKIFDLFYTSTVQLLYLLRLSYSHVTFAKPSTSRQSNSEKYVVCQGFKGYNKDISNLLIRNFSKSILPLAIPQSFINDIENYQSGCVTYQTKAINTTLSLIKQRRIYEKPTLYQLQKAKEWCKKYQIPINKQCIYTY